MGAPGNGVRRAMGSGGLLSHQRSQLAGHLAHVLVRPARHRSGSSRTRQEGRCPMRPLSGDCPLALSERQRRLRRLGQSNDIIRPYLCRSTPLNRGISAAGLVLARGIFWQVIGASETANTTEAGRIAAGLCPRQGMVRRSSWPGRRRRAGGGVMATGNRVLPGAPVTGEHTATGRQMAAEHVRAGQPPAAGPQDAGQPSAGGYAMPAGYPASGQQVAGQGAPKTRRAWSGAGGRWLVWMLRIVLWAVALLIGYRGVAANVLGEPGPGASATSASPGSQGRGFPSALAQAYALEFGQVYLRFS